MSFTQLSELFGSEGERIALPIAAEAGELIYSFEIILQYDPNILKYAETIKTSLAEKFQILSNKLGSGRLKIVGYALEPIIEPGEYIDVLFDVIGKNGEQSKIELVSYCINEDIEKSGIITFVVGIDETKLP